MASPVDITQSPKVREINKRILDKYGRYTPLEKRNIRFRVLQYSDPAEYQKALENTIQTRVNRDLTDLKQNQPDLYAQAWKLHGDTLGIQIKSLDYYKDNDRYQKAVFTSAGFYDPFTQTIHLAKTDPYYTAHELFHLYSFSKDSQGPYSYFESILKQDIAEGVIESLGLEVSKDYAKAHNLANELKNYENAEMPRILISKSYLEGNSFSNDSVLQLLFKGWFRYDEKKGFVPAERAPTSLDQQKFSAQETLNWKNGYRWLVPSKMPVKLPGHTAPGSTIPKSMTITGLPHIRPGTWQGGPIAGPANPFTNTHFGPNVFLNRFSELQRQAQERLQKRLQEEARRRSLEALRMSHNQPGRIIQEAEKKRALEMEKRRLEEEARRRAAEQKRAIEIETRRATEEAARRNQEAARQRAAMDALHNKRNVPCLIDHWKYKPGPNQLTVPWVHVYQGDKFCYSFKPPLNDILCTRKKW
ncbi:MAG: hypothetical protein NTW38_00570 [Candidatus Aminicenantes bacterium]|nr:hypothetical protein [Candidatus Aminicenantes bacterium]